LFDPGAARLFVWVHIPFVHHLIIFGPGAEGSPCDVEGTKYGEANRAVGHGNRIGKPP
jgi:hypothetical protein